MTRVLVAHSDRRTGDRQRAVLEHTDLQVADVVTTTVELDAACRRARPDVVVAGVQLDDGPLLAMVPQILRLEARLLVTSDDPPGSDVHRALLAGAAGCATGADSLAQAVRTVAAGGASLHPGVAEAVLHHWRATAATPPPSPTRPLTAREHEVLRLAADGLTNASIATRLGLSTKTIESHKARIFDKLGTRNQAEAIATAISDGVLTLVPGHLSRRR